MSARADACSGCVCRGLTAREEEATDGATETVNGFGDPAHLWSLDEIGPLITACVPVQEMESSSPTSLPSYPFRALQRRQHMAGRCFEDLFRLAQDFQSSADPPAGSGTSVREPFPRFPSDPLAEDLVSRLLYSGFCPPRCGVMRASLAVDSLSPPHRLGELVLLLSYR